MNRWIRSLEALFVAALFIAGSAFLLKLAYLNVLTATFFGVLFLLAFYGYVRWKYGVRVPMILLLLILGALEVDALGNHFRMYGRPFGPVQYDEFAHLLCSALVTPVVVWLLRAGIKYGGWRLPLGLITVFAIALLFALSGFYEIIELWDERYFGGQRIWSPHDAPNDLQWNLTGILIGAVTAYAVLKALPKQMAD